MNTDRIDFISNYCDRWCERTAAQLYEFQHQEECHEQRIRSSPLTKLARAYSMLSYRWLSGRGDTDCLEADEVLREAAAIVRHDSGLITAKLHRALAGKDARVHDGDDDEHPVQTDWNGSGKVALISIERSAVAWRLIADVIGDELPLELAMQLEGLVKEVESEFPQARAFERPGFDEPGR